MKNVFKRTLAILLTVVLLLTAAPLSGFVGLDIDFSLLDFSTKASALSTVTSSSNRDNVVSTFYMDTGLLIISGTGAMQNYNSSDSPFYNYGSIKSVVINNGVTSIGDSAFYGRLNAERIIFLMQK